MTDLLLEGIRASVQPCSLALVLPGVGLVVLGGRHAPSVAVGFLVAAVLTAWAQAAVLLDLGAGPAAGIGLGVLAATGLWLAAGAATTRRSAGGAAAMAAAGGVMTGAAAGLGWRPCVGPALGQVLTDAPAAPSRAVVPMSVYLLGLLALALAVAALPHLHPALARAMAATATRVLAAGPVMLLVIVLVTGRYEQVIGALLRVSSLT